MEICESNCSASVNNFSILSAVSICLSSVTIGISKDFISELLMLFTPFVDRDISSMDCLVEGDLSQ
ncbi:hypothetical protein D3C71_2028840 [compost metagenome]